MMNLGMKRPFIVEIWEFFSCDYDHVVRTSIRALKGGVG